MSKATVDRIKAEVARLDPAEVAMLTGWMHEHVRMDVPARPDDRCPHYECGEHKCRYPKVVE